MQITFDDEKTLADFNMAVQKGYEKPLMPSISNRTTAIPGMIGEWDHGSELGVIKEKYSIACFEQDPIEREKRFNEFIAYCSDMYRKPRLMKMRFSTEPDKFIYGKIYKSPVPKRWNSGGDFDLEIVNNQGTKFALADEYDPKNSPEYYKVIDGDIYKNTRTFTWDMRKRYVGICNHSPYTTPITIKICGILKNAKIVHINSKKELTLPNIKNQWLDIKGDNYTIEINGEGILKDSNFNFFEMEPGRNGFIFISDSPQAEVTFEWLHRF